MYYEGGIANAYFWSRDEDTEDYNCALLVKKDISEMKGITNGSWNSNNQFDVKIEGDQVIFSLVTTIVLEIVCKEKGEVF